MSTLNANTGRTAIGRHARARPSCSLITAPFERRKAAVLSSMVIAALSAVTALAQQGAPPAGERVVPAAPTVPASPPQPAAAIASWRQALIVHLARFQRYPAQARGALGVVTIAFSIDRNGNLVGSRIDKSSGSAILDADALAMIKRAAPLPRPPAEAAAADLSLLVPIRYTAGEQQ